MKSYLLVLFAVLVSGCRTGKEMVPTVVAMRVNSHTVECIGEAGGSCLLVQEGEDIGSDDWETFYYDYSIAGFDYEPGYIYNLIVRKTPVVQPLQDGSSIDYELVEIVSKERQ